MVRKLCSVLALAGALTFSACGGGGNGPVAPPGGGGGGGTVQANSGAIVGIDGVWSPTDGDSSTGGNGQTVDGVPCLPTMDQAHYHIHVFIGIMNSGVEEAIPDGTGMENPGPDSGGNVTTATCFYYLHTHDAAGIIHVEDPSTASRTTSLHSLGEYLDIWGHSFPSALVYTSGSFSRGEGDLTVSNTAYTQYTGDMRTIPLYAHEVIWIVSGPNFVAPSNLPGVHFSY